MKAVKGWMCGCTNTCAAVKTSKMVGDYDKPCYVVPAALWRQYRRVVGETRKALKTGVEVTLVNELDKLDEMEAKK